MTSSRRLDQVGALALAAVAFAVYASGAARTIFVGDSGELVAASFTVGIPHPSGYPLYVLLGKLWTLLLPWGSIAWRMSLFSACFAALAVGLTYLAGRALNLGRAAAFTGAVLFAASPSFWGEANIQRVYSLNAFFVALATLLAFGWAHETSSNRDSPRRRDRNFVLVAFVCGVGATNHTYLAVWGLAFLAFVVTRDPDMTRRWRVVAGAAVAAAAGLSLYAYLPLRSRQEPRLDWGNPETFDALLAVVSRRDFWGRRWWTGWHDLAPIVGDFGASFAVELTIAGALLAVVGLAVGLKGRLPVLLLVLAAMGNLAAMAAHGSRSDLFLWHRYYIPAYLCAALLAAIGVDVVVRLLAQRSPRAGAAVATLIALATLVLVPVRWHNFDRSRYRIAEDYSRMLLASLPPGARLSATDDNILFVLLYLQLVERVRPDVDLIQQGVAGDLPPLRFDPDHDALFFTHNPNWNHPALDVVPVGLVYQVVRAGSVPTLRLPARLHLDGEGDPSVPKDYLTHNLIGELHFMLGVTFERRDPSRALAEFEAASRAAPDNEVLAYNLGLVYQRMGLLARALACFERAVAINPRPIPGPTLVRASDKAEELRRQITQTRPAYSRSFSP